MATKNITDEKQRIREKMLQKRSEMNLLDMKRESDDIATEFLRLDEVKGSSKICIYASTKREVQTMELIDTLLSQNKEVFVPRCLEKGLMECYRIYHRSDLKEGKFGILEPRETCITMAVELDVIVVPGVCFDESGYRIGYGGGYYDRYLKKFPLAYTIGFCFGEFILPRVPKEEFDRRVDRMITQRK